MNNKTPQFLANLRVIDGEIKDINSSNHWINDYGSKTSVNTHESPFGNPNGCIEFKDFRDRLALDLRNYPNFDCKNTDWTVSFWMKWSEKWPATEHRGYYILCGYDGFWFGGNNSGNSSLTWYLDGDANSPTSLGVALHCVPWQPSSNESLSSKVIEPNLKSNWHHICVECLGNTIMFFIDGKLRQASSSDQRYSQIGWSCKDNQKLYVGGFTDGGGNDMTTNNYAYAGYIDDFVVIKNKALWTKDFTPPKNYLSLPKQIYIDSLNHAWGVQQ